MGPLKTFALVALLVTLIHLLYTYSLNKTTSVSTVLKNHESDIVIDAVQILAI